jgi:hypothetical protein
MGPGKCPFCGQEIDAEATKCFFCGEELDEASVEKRLEQLLIEDNNKPALKARCPFALQVIVIIILICIALFSTTSRRKPSTQQSGISRESMVRLNTNVTFTGSKFIISNNDPFEWINVEFQVTSEDSGGNFSHKVPKIPAGEIYSVRATEFAAKNGTSFNPYKMKPNKFRIWCDTPTRESGSYFAGWK